MSLLQYLNTKFPLEYNYLRAHGLLPFTTKPPGGDSHTDQHQGKQNAEALFFVLFCFLLVNFYSSYNLCLSTFKCYHKKGEIDETRRSNFRLFQVFLLYIQMAIDQRSDNKNRLTRYFVR